MGNEIEIAAPNARKRSGKALAAVTPSAMITQAIASGAGVEVMEKLMALHERWEAMQARKSFDGAMAELRQHMPTVIKSQEADFGQGSAKYKYEDLSAVTEALSPIMAEIGLSFRWRTASTPNGVAVTCIVSHRDGHSEETTLSAGMDTSGKKNAIQALGSAVTYLQRYTLKAAVGIAAAKDDDGVAAGEWREPTRSEPAKSVTKPSASAYEQFAAEIAAAKAEGALKAIWKRLNDTRADDLPQAEYDRLTDALNDRVAVLNDTPKDDFPGVLDPKATLDRQFGAAA